MARRQIDTRHDDDWPAIWLSLCAQYGQRLTDVFSLSQVKLCCFLRVRPQDPSPLEPWARLAGAKKTNRTRSASCTAFLSTTTCTTTGGTSSAMADVKRRAIMSTTTSITMHLPSKQAAPGNREIWAGDWKCVGTWAHRQIPLWRFTWRGPDASHECLIGST